MSNADDRCAQCGATRLSHEMYPSEGNPPGWDRHPHAFVEPSPQPGPPRWGARHSVPAEALEQINAEVRAGIAGQPAPHVFVDGPKAVCRRCGGMPGGMHLQPAPTLSTFNQVMAALRNPAVNLGDLDVCRACLSVESPYLHSAETACPTGPTVDVQQPAPSGDEAKVREIARAEAESIATRWVPAHMTARQGMVDDIAASLVRYRTLASENGCAKTAAEAWAGLQRGDNVIDLMESRERDAYAAGKADGARDNERDMVEYLLGLADDNEGRVTDALRSGRWREELAIARRGSEGK